jgi:outer membrane autotransporter protein
MSGPWHVGVAGGYENSDISTNGPRVSSDGDRGHLGGTVKYISGPWLASGTVAGGWTTYDSKRWISFPGFASTAKSDQDISNVGGQLRGAYLMTSGKWYAKPQVDLDVIYVDMDGFKETGGAGAALKVSGTDETVFIATPALEIGTQMGFNGVLARPFVRGGVSFYSDADFPLLAGFAAAPGVAPFKTTGEIDDVVGNISAGVTVLGTGSGVVTLSYDGAFGDDLESHSASAKASWRY